MEIVFSKPPIEPIHFFSENENKVDLLRLDLIHPFVSGNKWYKLQYYIQEAVLHKKGIVTKGGIWSNHLIATATACHYYKIPCMGIIKGSPPKKTTDTLIQVQDFGMKIFFTDCESIPGTSQFINVPMGGYGHKGALGASTILTNEYKDYTHIVCAVGSGTTMAGLLNTSLATQKIIGISALKNCYTLENEIRELLTNHTKQITLFHDYHFGGFAKHTSLLIDFINQFYIQTGIPLDIVYTGKMMYAIQDLIRKKYFPPESRILAIHSGGLQGNASVDKGMLLF